MRRLVILLACTLHLSAIGASTEETTSPQLHWYKGNTHTHTKNSDGDSTPAVVARWYRDNRYDFLVLTDHNFRTEVEELQQEISLENAEQGKKPFLLLPGEEISENWNEGDRKRSLHTNALGTTGPIGKQGGTGVVDILQRCIDAAHRAGALPQVNHPNFVWSLTADDLYALRNLKHFEIYNGHPHTNNLGGGGVPRTEQLWDNLLSRGRLYYGVAVDDAHNFKKFDRNLSNPGRGWVVVRAARLTPGDIIGALSRGDFYASTGVELDDITTSARTLRVKIRPHRNEKYCTEFIGKDGAILKRDETEEPSYTLTGSDLYVRARITASSGNQAWTQPLYTDAGELDRTR